MPVGSVKTIWQEGHAAITRNEEPKPCVNDNTTTALYMTDTQLRAHPQTTRVRRVGTQRHRAKPFIPLSSTLNSVRILFPRFH